MKKILVVGSLNMDQVTKVHHTPKVGETVVGNGLELIAGGKGANQAVAMGKLGADVTMIGMVGTDDFASQLLDNLKQMGVTDKVMKTDKASTGTALIMVNESADNSIVVIAGANGLLKPDMIKPSWFDDIDIVVLQLEIPLDTVAEIIKQAKARNIYTVLNPSPATHLDEDLLKDVDLLVVNETEFESLSGIAFEAEESLDKGYEKLKVKELVVTLGTKGSWYYDKASKYYVPALKVEAIDTTAAGDSYMGALVCEISKGVLINEAMEFATKVAAYTVTKLGAQSSLPTLEDLKERGLI